MTSKHRCLTKPFYDNIERWKDVLPNYSFYFHDDVAKYKLLERQYPQFPNLPLILPCMKNKGAELADLTPEEVFRMNVDERIDLLKANILHYTQDLLKYDVVEIRLIDRKNNRCEPLLTVGIPK